jgi:hypothetical protein
MFPDKSNVISNRHDIFVCNEQLNDCTNLFFGLSARIPSMKILLYLLVLDLVVPRSSNKTGTPVKVKTQFETEFDIVDVLGHVYKLAIL